MYSFKVFLNLDQYFKQHLLILQRPYKERDLSAPPLVFMKTSLARQSCLTRFLILQQSDSQKNSDIFLQNGGFQIDGVAEMEFSITVTFLIAVNQIYVLSWIYVRQ